MNLLQNLQIVVIKYLYRGRRAVALQTFLLDKVIVNCPQTSYGFVNHFYAMCPVNSQIRQNNAK